MCSNLLLRFHFQKNIKEELFSLPNNYHEENFGSHRESTRLPRSSLNDLNMIYFINISKEDTIVYGGNVCADVR